MDAEQLTQPSICSSLVRFISPEISLSSISINKFASFVQSSTSDSQTLDKGK